MGEEQKALYARLEDFVICARRGEVTVSDFLSPKEQYLADGFLKNSDLAFRFFGGYSDAERQRLYLLPEYMGDGEGRSLTEWLDDFGSSSEIEALKIQGSGYRVLTHRDFLGALLGLGLERSVLGDLAVDESGFFAILFCDAAMVPFLERELTKVASDKVKVFRLSPSEILIPPRRFATVTDTVATPRLDSVVAALGNFSRDVAKQTVCSGLVELNFEVEDRPDRTVSSGSLLSVRGVGKFRIVSLEEHTKKGRVKLLAEKFV